MTVADSSGTGDGRQPGHVAEGMAVDKETQQAAGDGKEGEATGAKRRREDDAGPCVFGQVRHKIRYRPDNIGCDALDGPGEELQGHRCVEEVGRRGAEGAYRAEDASDAPVGNDQAEMIKRRAARLGGKVRERVPVEGVRAPFKAPRSMTDVATLREVRAEVGRREEAKGGQSDRAECGDASNAGDVEAREAAGGTRDQGGDDEDVSTSYPQSRDNSHTSWAGGSPFRAAFGKEQERPVDEDPSMKTETEERAVAGLSGDMDDADDDVLTPESQKSVRCRRHDDALKMACTGAAARESDPDEAALRSDLPCQHPGHARPDAEMRGPSLSDKDPMYGIVTITETRTPASLGNGAEMRAPAALGKLEQQRERAGCQTEDETAPGGSFKMQSEEFADWTSNGLQCPAQTTPLVGVEGR